MKLNVKDKMKARASQFLADLLKCVSPVEVDNPSRKHWPEHDRFVLVIPQGDEAAFLVSTCITGSNPTLLEPLVNAIELAAIVLAEVGETSLDRFVEHLNDVYGRYEAADKIAFTILLPQEFYVRPIPADGPFPAHNYDPIELPFGQLSFANWDDFEKQVNLRHVGYTWDREEPPHEPKDVRAFSPLSLSLNCRNLGEARAYADRAVRLLQGADLVWQCRSVGSHPLETFGAKVRPLKPPPFTAIFIGKTISDKEYTRPPFNYDKWFLRSDRWLFWRETLEPLARGVSSDSSLERLQRAVEILPEGATSPDFRQAFLALWNVLEVLTNAPNGLTSEVCQRVAVLFPDVPTVRERIGAFSVIRNQFVHGFDWIGLGDIGPRLFLMDVTETVFRYWRVASVLKSATDMDAFLEMGQMSARRQSKKLDVLASIPNIVSMLSADRDLV